MQELSILPANCVSGTELIGIGLLLLQLVGKEFY